jgi:glyoxylase-like metal-dependent hydrolase (beta-lactamase superfamily II)
MAEEIPFTRDFDAAPGVLERVRPGVRRMLAPNPSPFTFTGTCTYVVGEGAVAVIDPGPDSAEHVAALVAALRGETVERIFITHTHRDHSGAVPALAEQTGAPTFGEGPHRAARPLHEGEPDRVEAGADRKFAPAMRLADGQVVEGRGYALEAIATPGHTANHLAFALAGTDCLFSGDHVMGWSTTIVAPPDGAMADYVASLHKLRARAETVYLPGHGAQVRDAHAYVDRLIDHRGAREAAILRRLERGESDIPAIVQAIYIGLDPRLSGAAAMTTLAHLENLVARGIVAADGAPTIASRYRLAR